MSHSTLEPPTAPTALDPELPGVPSRLLRSRLLAGGEDYYGWEAISPYGGSGNFVGTTPASGAAMHR